MQTIQADQFKPGMLAYIWEETGNGSLRRVDYIRQDWWIVTGHCSWCCCPDTTLYVFDSAAERKQIEASLRHRLEVRRIEWSKPYGQQIVV